MGLAMLSRQAGTEAGEGRPSPGHRTGNTRRRSEFIMALITWGPRLEVGIGLIDGHHRRLVDLINELNDALTEGRSKEVMGGIFDELIDYTRFHFRAEEGLMEEHGYDDFREHCHEHTVFEDQLAMYRESFEDGSKTVSESVLEFLRNWLLTHITGTDRGYISLFKNAGVQ